MRDLLTYVGRQILRQFDLTPQSHISEFDYLEVAVISYQLSGYSVSVSPRVGFAGQALGLNTDHWKLNTDHFRGPAHVRVINASTDSLGRGIT